MERKSHQKLAMGARALRAGAILCSLTAVFLVTVCLSVSTTGEEGETTGTIPRVASHVDGFVLPTGAAQDYGELPQAKTVAMRILTGESVAAIVSLAGQETGAGASRLPAGFEDEVLAASGFADVLVDMQANVVGWTCRGSSPEVFALVRRDLQAHGWHAVDSGSVCGGTFFKEEGEYRWVYVMCYQVGGSASVVLQYG